MASGGNTPPVPVVNPTIKLITPADGTVVTGQPVTISVGVSGGSDPSNIIALLDGVDITSRFGTSDKDGIRSVLVSEPTINYGKNQLQIRSGATKLNSVFILDTAKDVGATAGTADATRLLVPIKTRVLREGGDGTHAPDWGIQVGENTYYAPPPIEGASTLCSGSCNRGFQILLLSRADLHVVSNTSYDIENDSDLGPSSFVDALNGARYGTFGCTPAGCIMVMQSLTYVGWAGCWASISNCQGYVGTGFESSALTGIGASNSLVYANHTSPQVGYSFIGSGGSGHMPTGIGGTQFERLGCAFDDCTALSSFDPSRNTAPGDLSKVGAMSGVLIRDNYNSFTYSPNAPQLHYTFGTRRSGSSAPYSFVNILSLNGSTTEGAGQYTMTLPSGSRGGFRLVVLDRTNPISPDAKLYDKYYDVDTQLGAMTDNLINYSQAKSLFFIAALGDISHSNSPDTASPNRATPTAQVWERLAEQIEADGGDAITFRTLGYTQPAFNQWTPDPSTWDDYLLVTRPRPSGAALPIVVPQVFGAEAGFVINRHAVKAASTPTMVEGVLTLDNEGYYAPRLQGNAQGVASPQIASLASASLLPPVPWPFVSTSGQKAAYTWLSQELCCADIRASYVNLNADPSIWLTGMNQLVYPQNQSGSFSENDFSDVRSQLSIEFGYVTLVRNLQTNILGLYQSQQSNVGLILQQAEDEVQSNVYTDTPPPQPPTAWRVFTTDVFPTLENLAGFVPGGAYVKTSLGVATLVINTAIDHTNDASGNSQTMLALAEQDIAAAKLAQHAVNEYTDSLITLGNDFNRVLSDWGRLKSVGGPLSTAQLQWDTTASGIFLRAFNATTRRQYYPSLIARNPAYFVTHIQYADDHYNGSDGDYYFNNGNGCGISHFHLGQDSGGSYGGADYRGTAWYPGRIQISGPNPGYYWFDIWALGISPQTNDQCPDPLSTVPTNPLPSTFGMFDPLDPNDPSALGLWKPYVFQRSGIETILHSNPYFSNVP